MDLTEVVAGRGPSPALVLALVEGLPEDSATVAAMRGGAEWRGWTQQTRVLADLYDAVMADVAVNAAHYSKAKKVKPVSKPYPRPQAKQRRGQRVDDVRRALGAAPRSVEHLIAPPAHVIPPARV